MADRPAYVWTGSAWDTIADPGAVRNGLIQDKGKIAAGNGTTAAALSPGTNEHRLVADSAQSLGLKYVADTTNYAIAAKGDLLVGTAADTVTALTVGTDGHVLTAASGETSGVKWQAPAGGGKVLQVVSTTKTDTFSTTSGTFVDVTGLSVNITPAVATSKILVIASFMRGVSGDAFTWFNLVRDSTSIAIGDAAGSRKRTSDSLYAGSGAQHMLRGNITHVDSPNTTSQVTYKVQTATEAGTVYVNRTGSDSDAAAQPRMVSSITAIEIGA